MADYTNFGNQTPIKEKKTISSTAINMGRVFGYMALAILATCVFTGIFGFIIWTLCECSYIAPNVISVNYDKYLGFVAGGIVPLILMIVCSILAGSFAFKQSSKSRSVLIPFTLYAISIGYVFGLIFPFIPYEIILIALGSSVLVYGLLALIGTFAKGNMNPLMMCAGGLLSGIFIISLINMIFIWFVPTVVVDWLFWVVSLGIFAVLMLTTIWDVWHIKTIVSQNNTTPNMTLFLAFRLYVDFIAIFMRILYYLLIIFGRNNK